MGRFDTLDDATAEDVLDSRDLEELIDDLEEQEAEAEESDGEFEHADDLEALRDLREEVGSEWRHGVTLVSDDHWQEYAEEMAGDIYDKEALGALASYID
jgi:hypothetical protein